MTVTLFPGMSIDGFIADKNGDEDFLSDEHWYEFVRLCNERGVVIVGRKAYESVENFDGLSWDDVKAKKIVVSKNPDLKVSDAWTVASSPTDAIEKAEGSDILLGGGGNISAAFMDEGLIDEIIFNIEPVLVGEGVPFIDHIKKTRLELQDVSEKSDGIVQIRYLISPSST